MKVKDIDAKKQWQVTLGSCCVDLYVHAIWRVARGCLGVSARLRRILSGFRVEVSTAVSACKSAPLSAFLSFFSFTRF